MSSVTSEQFLLDKYRQYIEKMEKILSDITNKSKTSIKKEITDEEALELEKELRKMGYI